MTFTSDNFDFYTISCATAESTFTPTAGTIWISSGDKYHVILSGYKKCVDLPYSNIILCVLYNTINSNCTSAIICAKLLFQSQTDFYLNYRKMLPRKLHNVHCEDLSWLRG